MTRDDLTVKVFAFTSKDCLVSAPCHVVLGLSGGADSMALLHMLVHWPVPGLRVSAVHVHHGLRGANADRDETFVRDICDRYGVVLTVQHVDVAERASNQHISVEEAGRTVRYEIFESIRKELGADYIFTAHTASDQVETLLMRLIRGTGPDGLDGIQVIRGAIRRPLLCCNRAEIEAYCAQHDIPYVTDETNMDVQYTRNRIRHEVLPLLRRINPAADDALLRFRYHVRLDSTYMRGLSGQALDKARQENGYDCSVFNEQHFTVRRRMILSIMDRAGVPDIEESHILAAEKVIHSKNGSVSLPGRKVLAAEQGIVSIRDVIEPTHPAPITVFELPATLSFGDEQYSLSVVDKKQADNENVHKLFSKSTIDYDTIRGSLYIRCRQEGDRIHPAGRGVGKSLKKLMNELRIPSHLRDTYPLLCDDEGVLLIPGYTCDQRACVTEDTKHFLVWQPVTKQG
ncbi:MAG: tRNA lysidine(34) synthetase TilS [Clostridia bacterium]|nr:tRNA lysidine(34) synthetase TilS [Clostridia bacterium]